MQSPGESAADILGSDKFTYAKSQAVSDDADAEFFEFTV